MSATGGPSAARRSGVYGFTAVYAAAGVALTSYASSAWNPERVPVHLTWWMLLPVYVLALQRPLEYELRRETRMLTLTQIPMTVALVCLAPWWHLLARTGAALVDVLLRRQPPMKALYNIGVAVVEVGVASSVLAMFTHAYEPRPALWGALVAAMSSTEAVEWLAISFVLWLVGARRVSRALLPDLLSTLSTALPFTTLGIVAVAAAWTDASTLAVIGLMTLGLGLGYRRHRRLSAEAQQQAEIQRFLKALGPMDLNDDLAAQALVQIRELLQSERLSLVLRLADSWTEFLTSEGADVEVRPASTPSAGAVATVEADHMSSPLLHEGELIGVLSATERMGMNHFTMRDVRLIEIVAAELAKSIDRGQLQRRLALAATTDPLTKLPNLNETSRRLDALLREQGSRVVLAAVAVDSFREVNDTLGHEVGDELLLEVARRIRLNFPEAVIGRIGGGRFAVAAPSERFGNDTAMFGLGLRAQVEGSAQLGPVGTHIKLSVGCVAAPEHGDDAATLIRRAETAMYGARSAHGGPVVWEPVYEIEGQRRLAVVMALREALTSGAIGVAFQPKLSSQDLRVTGVEALARWTHPALGAISPAEFVPLAEAAGLMGPLTSTVLRQALTACKGWQRRGGRVGVAVNVSAGTILDPSFVTEVAAILTSVNISPDLLTLELTEGVVVDDPELAAQRLAEMRALGVKISVDDFGTGYSSLTYLKGLPVDEVKIDKGFVDAIAHDPADRAVVRAVVDIAHTMGLRVVAEGVEHVDQGQFLAQLGVDEVQGYLHARPMAALDVSQWLRRREEAVRDLPAQPLGQ